MCQTRVQRYDFFGNNWVFLQSQNLETMNIEALLTNTYTLILLIILALSFVVLAVYYGLIYVRVGLFENKKIPKATELNESKMPSVSVVLTTHNEASFLKDSLVYLLEQDYPNYEVVVVNYISSDDTEFVLKVCGENYPHLKAIAFKEDVNMFSGKKYPLSIGIKSAKNDVLVLTEPDSVPKSFSWLRSIVAGYMHGADVVLGYSGIRQEKGLLNSMMQYDNLCQSASMFGWAIMGNPYTGNGRNLSYRRNFFFDRGAFIRHYTEPEGADDLFVNQNANKRNTAMALEEGSFVQTEPRKNFHQWHLQRKAHYTTKKYYGWKDKLLLMVHPTAVLLFYLSLVLMLVASLRSWIVPLVFLVVDWAWQIVAFSLLTKRFSVKNVHFFAPLYEIYFLLANTFLCLTSLHKKTNRWR